MLALDKTDVLMADLGTGLDLGFEVRNFSESTVKLTDFYLQTIPCDPDSPHVWDRVDASMVFGPELVPDEEAEDDPILIDPASAQNGLVTRTEAGVLSGGRLIRDSREISPEICWYGYHVAGLADGLPAVGSIYVQLQDNPVTRQTVDPTTAATLDGLKEHLDLHGIDPEQEGIDIDAVTSEDLYHLEQRGLLTRTINGWTLRGE